MGSGGLLESSLSMRPFIAYRPLMYWSSIHLHWEENKLKKIEISVYLFVYLSICLSVLSYLPWLSNRFHIATLKTFSCRDSQTFFIPRLLSRFPTELSNPFYTTTLKLFSYCNSHCFFTAIFKTFSYRNSQTVFLLQLPNLFHTANLKLFSLGDSQTIFILQLSNHFHTANLKLFPYRDP